MAAFLAAVAVWVAAFCSALAKARICFSGLQPKQPDLAYMHLEQPWPSLAAWLLGGPARGKGSAGMVGQAAVLEEEWLAGLPASASCRS